MASFATEYVPEKGELRESVSQPDECFDLSNVSIPACLQHFHDESDKELAEALNRIRQQLKKDLALLDETQAKWVAFRNSECKIRSIPARGFADPDRQELLFTEACVAKLNALRVLQLKELPLGCERCLE
jgi:uncharacterized protein YecT (DUF1311 family)